jgi:polar amino acid transport system ATP-binding protein
MSPIEIQVEDLYKRFGAHVVLDGVSLRVGAGEIVALSGPSGCGKTTLLRCINGLETADAGAIRVGDCQLTAMAPGGATRAGSGARERTLLAVRRQVGFVFQHWNLFAHRTVVDNIVEAPVHVAHVPAGQAREQARALLDRVGIGARALAYPHQLSGGEQQRAAIARALAMGPRALLLDEPTSALDRSRRRDLADLLRGLVSEGLALLCVTHDPDFAHALGAQVLELAAGKIVAAGSHDGSAPPMI